MKQMRFFVFALVATMMFAACGKDDKTTDSEDNIYQFKVLNGQGDSVSLSIYEGQVLLVVNTATQCGYTPQYEDLERIYGPRPWETPELPENNETPELPENTYNPENTTLS